VKDPEVHVETLIKLVELAQQLTYKIKGITFSPIKGPKGNIEYLLYLCLPRENDFAWGESETEAGEITVRTVVSQAWETLR
ncbi:MAG TPA: TlyA family rRNA (cytidine-2'-O)-methyltransferase, partial [Firmicutes bacterium]|nr:TlyA family rRNA (cytidine-2'-O)-methyltransferase [Bacillota bacterium]